MRTHIKLPALAVSTVLVAGLLGACSNGTVQDATPVPVVSATTGTGVETPKAPEAKAIKSGDKLADPAAIDAATKAGLDVYNDWETGENFAFDPASPLPKNVKKAIAEPVRKSVEKFKNVSGSSQIALDADSQAASASASTGRTVIVLAAMHGERDGRKGVRYSSWNPDFDATLPAATVSWSHDEALAKTKAWIAKQKDSDRFDIVDATKLS